MLESLFQQRAGGAPAPFNAVTFSRRLYQAEVPDNLLTHLHNRHGWDLEDVVRDLHGGWAIAFVRRNDGYGDPVPDELERAIGDRYLLIFAAVAINRYEELHPDSKMLYAGEVEAYIESLERDGYRLENGRIFNQEGHAVTAEPVAPPPAPPAAPLPAPPVHPDVAPQAAAVAPDLISEEKPWSTEAKIALWSLVILGILAVATIVATVASPEVRVWLHLEKPPAPIQAPKSEQPPTKTLPIEPGKRGDEKNSAAPSSNTHGQPPQSPAPPLRLPEQKQAAMLRQWISETQTETQRDDMWLSQVFQRGHDGIPDGPDVDAPATLRYLATRREVEIVEETKRTYNAFGETFNNDIRFKIKKLGADGRTENIQIEQNSSGDSSPNIAQIGNNNTVNFGPSERHLTPEMKKTLATDLLPYKGQKLFVAALGTEKETANYKSEWIGAFREAGWEVEDAGTGIMSGGAPQGLHLMVHDKDLLTENRGILAFNGWLKKHGMSVPCEIVSEMDKNRIVLKIGAN